MAKKSTGRPKTGQNNTTAKIDALILRRVRHIADFRGITIPEYLNAIVGPAAERDMKLIAGETLRETVKPGK